MGNLNSKKTVKRENRIQAFCIYLAGMEVNEEAKITNIAKEIGVHVNSVKDIVDSYETIKDAATIVIVRGKDDKIKRIVRVRDEDRDLTFKKEIRDSIVNINNSMDQVKEDVKSLKKKKGKKSK